MPDKRKRPSGTIFRFMFFDALSPAYLGGFRAFYVFCPVFLSFWGRSESTNSGLILPKDKAASHRQYEEYGKAKPIQQRRILVKEDAMARCCKRQGGEPQAVRGVRQGEANAVFWQRKTLWLDVAKDKVVSRRQTMQYGKARPTRQRRILVKENAIPLRRCPEYGGWRVGVLPHWLFPDRGRYHVGLIWIASDHCVERF